MCNVCFWIDNNNTRLNLINIYGTDDNDDKILLNLCYVNKNYYIVLYEPDWLYNINCTVKWSDISYLKNNKERFNNYNNKEKEIINKNNFIYSNDNRRIKYIDIINYINKSQNNEENRYPKYIYDIDPRKKEKLLKNNFVSIAVHLQLIS